MTPALSDDQLGTYILVRYLSAGSDVVITSEGYSLQKAYNKVRGWTRLIQVERQVYGPIC